jgi:hypothetical protein
MQSVEQSVIEGGEEEKNIMADEISGSSVKQTTYREMLEGVKQGVRAEGGGKRHRSESREIQEEELPGAFLCAKWRCVGSHVLADGWGSLWLQGRIRGVG